MKPTKKVAVVLFNLGGPLNSDGVYPFLKSLFGDPAILPLPKWPREWLASWIARRRTPEAQEIYNHLDGKSPLLENTQAQAEALEKALGKGYAVFSAMRHAPPLIDKVLPAVRAEEPDEIVLVPLYPQFSTTTTGSAFKEWNRQAKEHHFSCPTQLLCCYPQLHGFAEAIVDLIHNKLSSFKEKPRLLFSAHGLPQRTVKGGDPYVSQVHRSVQEVVSTLALSDLDWSICYQSKVGPLEWTRPSLDEALEKAAQDQVPVLIIPISFVSEHSETLVELDITYRNKAKDLALKQYERLDTVSSHPYFIRGLARFIKERKSFCEQCSTKHSKCWRNENNSLDYNQK